MLVFFFEWKCKAIDNAVYSHYNKSWSCEICSAHTLMVRVVDSAPRCLSLSPSQLSHAASLGKTFCCPCLFPATSCVIKWVYWWMGPSYLTVTWYKTCHAGGQKNMTATKTKQLRPVKFDFLCFGCSSLQLLQFSITNFEPCDCIYDY